MLGHLLNLALLLLLRAISDIDNVSLLLLLLLADGFGSPILLLLLLLRAWGFWSD